MFKKLKARINKTIEDLKNEIDYQRYQWKMKHLSDKDKAVVGYISTIVNSEIRRQEMFKNDILFNLAIMEDEFE